jgi:hypothetical protein
MAFFIRTTLARGSSALRGLCLLVACSASSAFAALPAGDLGSFASLDQLIGQPNHLSSPDGTLVLSDFEFAIAGTVNLLPSDIELQLTTSPDTLSAVLQVSITGTSQILFSGNNYNFTMSYALESLDPSLVFRQVSLDIEAGTVGTSGTGLVEVAGYFNPDPVVAEALFAEPQIPPSPLVRVFNDGDNGQLLKQQTTLDPASSKLSASIQVFATGGTDSQSGAVLTDFSIGAIRAERIPEPSTVYCLAIAIVVGSVLRRVSQKT